MNSKLKENSQRPPERAQTALNLLKSQNQGVKSLEATTFQCSCEVISQAAIEEGHFGLKPS